MTQRVRTETIMDKVRIMRLKLANRHEATADQWQDIAPDYATALREKAAQHRIAARAN